MSDDQDQPADNACHAKGHHQRRDSEKRNACAVDQSDQPADDQHRQQRWQHLLISAIDDGIGENCRQSDDCACRKVDAFPSTDDYQCLAGGNDSQEDREAHDVDRLRRCHIEVAAKAVRQESAQQEQHNCQQHRSERR